MYLDYSTQDCMNTNLNKEVDVEVLCIMNVIPLIAIVYHSLSIFNNFCV